MAQQLSDKKNKGYVLLISVILLGSFILSLSLYFSWLTSFMLRNGTDFTQAKQAQYLADTCAETALQKIWDDTSFSGSGTLSYSGGECSYQVYNEGGENRKIYSTGMFYDKVKKMQVFVDAVDASVNISSWRSVADFN